MTRFKDYFNIHFYQHKENDDRCDGACCSAISILSERPLEVEHLTQCHEQEGLQKVAEDAAEHELSFQEADDFSYAQIEITPAGGNNKDKEHDNQP